MEPKKVAECAVFIGSIVGTLIASRAVANSKRYAVTRATARAGKSVAKATVRAGTRRRR